MERCQPWTCPSPPFVSEQTGGQNVHQRELPGVHQCSLVREHPRSAVLEAVY